ncbi:MAG: ATP-binding protein [Oscillospiraceae bacterium]|jgi:predicted ATPase|nr:ATP-binding protein [Oscillospiraceae bacterium]
MHKITINNFGPLTKCEIEMNEFLVFTGSQASGKSTIVRLVYFFRTIKNELIDLISKDEIQGKSVSIKHELQHVLKEKLKLLFGPSFIMPSTMKVEYFFSDKVQTTITLSSDKYYNVEFSHSLEDKMYDIGKMMTTQISTRDFERISQRVFEVFDDNADVVFVPAGRSMITLLTDVLNYFMLQADKEFSEKIDYSTREFLRLIIKARPFFAEAAPSPNKEDDEMMRVFNLLHSESEKLLGGVYKYEDYQERLYYGKSKYVKINFASSGQQEALWVLNIMQYLTYHNRNVLFIVEEPEAHLYPDAQAKIVELLSIFARNGFAHAKNSVMVTTHSPYILAQFNVLLLCGKLLDEDVKSRIHKRKWLLPKQFGAFHIDERQVKVALSDTDGLIINELIDGVSGDINDSFDWLFDKYIHQKETQLDGIS